MRRYLEPFRVEGDPEDMQVYSADCGRAGAVPGMRVEAKLALYVETLSIFEGRMRDEMLGKLLTDARDTGTAHSNEFVRVRASAAKIDGTTVVLPSTPDAHLPTLAALLVRSGAEYYGDEMVKIEPVTRQLFPSALPLLIDTTDLVSFPELARPPIRGRRRPAVLPAATPRRPVAVDELGGTIASPSPVDWVVFPAFAPGAETALEEIGRAEALFAFTQAMLNLNVWGERAVLLLQGLLASSRRVARLTVGSLDDAASTLLAAAGAEARG